MRAFLYDPTGNMTILVESPVPPSERKAVAAALMQRFPEAEQLGFLSEGSENCDLRLDMAGGEFCGNATMSAAVHYVRTRDENEKWVTVSVSGTPKPLRVWVEKAESGCRGSVYMPLPESITEVSVGGQRLPLVSFGGIRHLISDGVLSREEAEKGIRSWAKELDCDCLGVMLYEREVCRLTPLVYVAGIDTLFWENSCASGTAAMGAWLHAAERKPIAADFSEPAGVLRAECDGSTLILRGHVRLKLEIS